MKRRVKLSKRVSKKHFRQNAGAKRINYAPVVMRGGIRL